MYIEFSWPDQISHKVIVFISDAIKDHVALWADRHGIKHRSKLVKRRLRITLDQDSHYTLFVTSWTPPQVGKIHDWWFDYQIVEPMKQ
jgi:hypothetical protein